jgi:predicted TIM-barrel fold metal-dependent hydrolase
LPLRLPPVVAERVTNQMRQRPRYGNISGEAMRQYHLSRYNWNSWDFRDILYTMSVINLGMIEAVAGFFHYGVFEKFPKLRFGVLEAGAGWLGSFLDRLDALKKSALGAMVPLRLKPSEYFKRQCFISGDPDEGAMAYAIKYLGPEIFAWATDYPHPDHTESWVPELEELLERLDERSARLVMGENIRRIYKLN